MDNAKNTETQNKSVNSFASVDSVFAKVRPLLPKDFQTLPNESKFSVLVQALDSALDIDGQWFLVNGELPLKDFFNTSDSHVAST